MKTIKILWKRFWAESPAILKRVARIVLRLSAALSSAAASALLLIDQLGIDKVEWSQFLKILSLVAGFVFAFIVGLKMSTSNPDIQNLSDPKTGLPK